MFRYLKISLLSIWILVQSTHTLIQVDTKKNVKYKTIKYLEIEQITWTCRPVGYQQVFDLSSVTSWSDRQRFVPESVTKGSVPAVTSAHTLLIVRLSSWQLSIIQQTLLWHQVRNWRDIDESVGLWNGDNGNIFVSLGSVSHLNSEHWHLTSRATELIGSDSLIEAGQIQDVSLSKDQKSTLLCRIVLCCVLQPL